MTAPISLDEVQGYVVCATRQAVGSARVPVTDTSFELLLSLIIVLVVIVLLLSQEDLGVGMAL
jgi:hypothetical protein